MIISRLDLKAFGRFTDVSIDLSAGPRRFHLIYGPNESGKSTSLRAITSLLYGMPQAVEDCFVHQTAQVRVGGLLEDPITGASLECVRRRGKKGTLRDALDKEPIDESQLTAMLGGINRETFLSRFGLSYESLVEGGAAILKGNGDLGQILFAAGAGVGRLREIQDELDQAASLLFVPRGSKATINSALRKLDEDRKALRDAQIPTASFAALRDRVDTKQREVETLDQSLRDCVVALARMQCFQQALPLLPEWHAVKEAFQRVADAPVLDDDFTERRRQVLYDRESAVSRHKELETKIKELTSRLQSLGSDPVVVGHELEIQSAFQEISAREKAKQDRGDLTRSMSKLDREATELLRDLSIEIEHDQSTDLSEIIERSIAELNVNDSLRARIRELAASHAGLVSRRNDANEAVEMTNRRLADAVQEMEALVPVGDPDALASVIDSIGNPESEMDTLLVCRQNCGALRRRCELMLQTLEGFDGDLAQAMNLALPSDAAVRQLTESLRCALHDVTQSQSSLQELHDNRDTIQQQLSLAVADRPLPTLLELQSARQDRDHSAERLVEAVRDSHASISDVEELRRQIRRADQLIDTMREYAEQVHRLESLTRQLGDLDSKIRSAKQASDAAHARFESAKTEWLSVWQSCRVSAGQPEQMQQWLANHGKLCDLMDQLESEERRLEQIQGRIGRSVLRLRHALDSVHSSRPVAATTAFQTELFDDPTDDDPSVEDLLSRYDEAVALRGQWNRERQQYDSVRRRRDELAEELPKAVLRFEASQLALENWEEDWRALTASFVKSERAGTAEVLHMLDQIGQLRNLKRERDAVAAMLHSIDQGDQAFAARVDRLANAIDHKSSDQQPSFAIAHAMYQRLQDERAAKRGRETLDEQVESSRQRLSELVAQRNDCDLVLKQLCVEAGCESPEDLPEIERRSKERSQSQARFHDLNTQLLRLAGDQSLDEFVAVAVEQQPAVLAIEIEREEARQLELREKIECVHQEIGAAQNELNRIDGGSRASDLAQSMQMTAGVIRADVECYAQLKVGAMILKRAIEHYRRENQSPVLALANQYFCQLTCGEYVELKPDYETSGGSTLFGVNARGMHVPVAGMSTGTADALYLALRLASLRHQMNEGKAVPVVIDDCLIQLDDARAAAALGAFSDLSEKTQVILFTHHQHLCQLAEKCLGKDDFHLHQIGV